MTVPFENIRIGLAGARFKKRAPDASCLTGGMYLSPAAGETVDTSKPVTISWNPTCLSPPSGQIDIYLYAPSANQSLVHVWENVPAAPGTFTTQFKPKWWKSTPSMGLQLTIIESGTPAFAANFPAGPIFTASYSAPTDGSTPAYADFTKPESGITNVSTLGQHKLSPGKVAAAVIMPILVVIALGVAFWIRKSRVKGKEKRKLWSEAVDKRMSTISTDWKSVTIGGAKEAIRHSMAMSANSRMSGFPFGAVRPQSTASELGMGQAGIGAQGSYGLYQHENESFNPEFAPPMYQLRPGLRSSSFSTERVSRVSFANDPRPKSRYNEKSIYGESPLPPLPKMSIDQASGPLSLTAEDIRARMQGVDQDQERSSMDEVMPALSMMRTGGSPGAENDDYLLWETPTSPDDQSQPPPPTQDQDLGMMSAVPANTMSPDDMLRAYAARSQSPVGPTFPQRAAKFASKSMRRLYGPTVARGAKVMGGVGLSGNNRMSVSQFNEEDAYIGTAT